MMELIWLNKHGTLFILVISLNYKRVYVYFVTVKYTEVNLFIKGIYIKDIQIKFYIVKFTGIQ